MNKSKITCLICSFLAVVMTGCILFGCSGVEDGGDGTTVIPSDDTTSGETEDPLRPGNDVTGNETFELETPKAKMTLIVKDNELYITSLTSEKGTQYADNAKITFPYVGEDMKYISAETYLGEKGDAGFKFVFTGTDTRYDLYVSSSRNYTGPFEFWGYLSNISSNAITYNPKTYFGFDTKFPSRPTATTFHKEGGMAEGWMIYSGQKYNGKGIYETELRNTVSAVASYNTNQNWNSGGDISMMFIDTDTEGMYIGHEWTSGMITAKGIDNNGSVNIAVALGDRTFKTELPAGRSMLLPSVYVGVYDGDIDDGSNQYKRWFFNCKAPDNMAADQNEPLVQQDMQLGIKAEVASYGIQAVKWDYGWWTAKGDGSEEGTLVIQNNSYLGQLRTYRCKTLADFAKKADTNGLKLTLYVLLHDTKSNDPSIPSSVAHPEWYSDRTIKYKEKSSASADLGNVECVAAYQKYLSDFFKETGVTTWRSDFEPICFSSNKANRHFANGKDVQYWCTVGFGELVDYIIDNVDGFRYESCCSGGGMKDLFTMTKASVINCEDSADYMSAHMSFYDSSYAIHPAQLQLPVNSLTYTEGSQYYTGTADFKYGLRCQMTGAVMLSNWKGTNSEVNETEVWKTEIKTIYNKKLKPLIREGDLYHILPRPDGKHWDGLEYVDADSENLVKAAVMIWKPKGAENTKTVKLRGLKADVTYDVSFTDHKEQKCQMTGAELMENGLTVIFDEAVSSDIIFFQEVKK